MTEATNLPDLAQQILQSCKVLAPSRAREVERALQSLRQRTLTQSTESDRAWIRKQLEEARGPAVEVAPLVPEEEVEASMASVERYIECLYDSVEQKIFATRRILQLARSPRNREELITNGGWCGC